MCPALHRQPSPPSRTAGPPPRPARGPRPPRLGDEPVARIRRPLGPALLLACLALSACLPAGSDARDAGGELLAREVLAAWEAGDVEEMAEHFWPDAIYDDFSNGTTWQGIEEILAYKAELHAWASDVMLDVTAVHPSASGVVAEWVLYGVHTGPIGGRMEGGTGREFLLNGVTVLEVEGDRVVRAADYLDTLPLMLQIGGRVELPGGEVLTLEGTAG